MTTSAHTGLARVTIVAPATRVDVALPHTATLAELLPSLLRLAGEDVADHGARHGGWSLARLGERAFDTGLTVDALAIRDGDLLHLRPQRDQLPPPVFDDVVDAIATTASQRAARWRAADTRSYGLGIGGGLLVLGALAVSFAGRNRLLAAAVAVAAAMLLIAGGAVLSRALSDSTAGAVLGFCGVAYGFVAGLVAVATGTGVGSMGRPDLLLGCAALTLGGVLAAGLIGDYPAVFLGAATTGILGGTAALLALLTSVTTHSAAALTAAATMGLAPILPVIALRLARLPLPAVPADAQDMSDDATSVPGPGTGARAELAEQYLTGLLGACCAVLAGAQVLLVTSGRTDARVLCVIISGALLLRARVHWDRTQRQLLLAAGLVGALAVLISVNDQAGTSTRLLAVLGVLILSGAVSIAVALLVPGRPISPYGARIVDIVEVLLLVSVIPVALAVVGLYSQLRGLAG